MFENYKLIFRLHALTRMAQRGFEPADVRKVLSSGVPIEQYPDDFPYPSCLVMATVGGRPIHVVVAMNGDSQEVIIVTVYEPDALVWGDGYTRRLR